jgi:hypothetical protein
MTDQAFAAVTDRPRYSHNGFEMLQAHLRHYCRTRLIGALTRTGRLHAMSVSKSANQHRAAKNREDDGEDPLEPYFRDAFQS